MIHDSKPNIYQVWTFKQLKIILAMQAGGQNKHYEMPDPMFGFGGLQKLSEPWPKTDLRMWICSLNRDKRECGESGKKKIKTTWGPANSPSDISAEKWILCGWWVAEGMGKPTEETLVPLNNNITSPDREVWEDFCDLRAASGKTGCCHVYWFLWEGSSKTRDDKEPNGELSDIIFMNFCSF